MRALVVILTSFVLSVGPAAESVSPSPPALTLSVPALEFGEVLSTDSPVETVQITNTSTRSVTIRRVVATCSCTKACVQAPCELRPQEHIDLKVRLQLADYPTNEVKSRVLVQYGADSIEHLTLPVTASIRPEYILTADRLDFGQVRMGSTPSATIRVRQNTEAPFQVVFAEGSKGIEIGLDQDAFGVGGKVRQSEYVVTASLASTLDEGHFSGNVVINTSALRVPKVTVPVSADIVGIRYTITPKVLVFGPSLPGSPLGVLTVSGSKDLVISKAEPDKPDLDCQIKPSGKPGTYEVAVKLEPTSSRR